MPPTPRDRPNPRYSSGAIASCLLLWFAMLAHAGWAGAQTAIVPEGDAAPASDGQTLLADALDCRVDDIRLPYLLRDLRKAFPGDFVQVARQYSSPDMDLYRLAAPVGAWGSASDAVVLAANRVMLAVEGSADQVSARVDEFLASPSTGRLDANHALVVYPAGLPGLEGMTLVGCEYRIEGLSLIDDPDDAWPAQPKAEPSPPSTTP